MSEITIKIEAPELATAIAKLAEALQGRSIPVATVPVGMEAKATPVNPTTAEQAQATATATPVQTAPATVSAPAPAPTVTTPTASTAPTTCPSNPAPTKAYTVDDLSRAGATLIDQGKMAQLLDLLGKYGVQAVTQLDASHYPAFVEDMKALGAQL